MVLPKNTPPGTFFPRVIPPRDSPGYSPQGTPPRVLPQRTRPGTFFPGHFPRAFFSLGTFLPGHFFPRALFSPSNFPGHFPQGFFAWALFFPSTLFPRHIFPWALPLGYFLPVHFFSQALFSPDNLFIFFPGNFFPGQFFPGHFFPQALFPWALFSLDTFPVQFLSRALFSWALFLATFPGHFPHLWQNARFAKSFLRRNARSGEMLAVISKPLTTNVNCQSSPVNRQLLGFTIDQTSANVKTTNH